MASLITEQMRQELEEEGSLLYNPEYVEHLLKTKLGEGAKPGRPRRRTPEEADKLFAYTQLLYEDFVYTLANIRGTKQRDRQLLQDALLATLNILTRIPEIKHRGRVVVSKITPEDVRETIARLVSLDEETMGSPLTKDNLRLEDILQGAQADRGMQAGLDRGIEKFRSSQTEEDEEETSMLDPDNLDVPPGSVDTPQRVYRRLDHEFQSPDKIQPAPEAPDILYSIRIKKTKTGVDSSSARPIKPTNTTSQLQKIKEHQVERQKQARLARQWRQSTGRDTLQRVEDEASQALVEAGSAPPRLQEDDDEMDFTNAPTPSNLRDAVLPARYEPMKRRATRSNVAAVSPSREQLRGLASPFRAKNFDWSQTGQVFNQLKKNVALSGGSYAAIEQRYRNNPFNVDEYVLYQMRVLALQELVEEVTQRTPNVDASTIEREMGNIRLLRGGDRRWFLDWDLLRQAGFVEITDPSLRTNQRPALPMRRNTKVIDDYRFLDLARTAGWLRDNNQFVDEGIPYLRAIASTPVQKRMLEIMADVRNIWTQEVQTDPDEPLDLALLLTAVEDRYRAKRAGQRARDYAVLTSARDARRLADNIAAQWRADFPGSEPDGWKSLVRNAPRAVTDPQWGSVLGEVGDVLPEAQELPSSSPELLSDYQPTGQPDITGVHEAPSPGTLRTQALDQREAQLNQIQAQYEETMRLSQQEMQRLTEQLGTLQQEREELQRALVTTEEDRRLKADIQARNTEELEQNRQAVTALTQRIQAMAQEDLSTRRAFDTVQSRRTQEQEELARTQQELQEMRNLVQRMQGSQADSTAGALSATTGGDPPGGGGGGGADGNHGGGGAYVVTPTRQVVRSLPGQGTGIPMLLDTRTGNVSVFNNQLSFSPQLPQNTRSVKPTSEKGAVRTGGMLDPSGVIVQRSRNNAPPTRQATQPNAAAPSQFTDTQLSQYRAPAYPNASYNNTIPSQPAPPLRVSETPTQSSGGTVNDLLYLQQFDRTRPGTPAGQHVAEVAYDVLYPGKSRREHIFSPMREALKAVRVTADAYRDYVAQCVDHGFLPLRANLPNSLDFQ